MNQSFDSYPRSSIQSFFIVDEKLDWRKSKEGSERNPATLLKETQELDWRNEWNSLPSKNPLRVKVDWGKAGQ
jgi:hypothetical protein